MAKKNAGKKASDETAVGATGPTGGKHNEVTAESLKRRAAAHMTKSREHKGYADECRRSTSAQNRTAMHDALTTMHAETCEILNHEAKNILDQPHHKG